MPIRQRSEKQSVGDVFDTLANADSPCVLSMLTLWRQFGARGFFILGLLSVIPIGPGISAAPQGQGDLPVSLPEAQGVDSARLATFCRFLNEGPLDIRSLLIVRHGFLVFERYEQGLTTEHNHYVYSVTKSVTSTLVGIALDRKLLADLEQPVLPFFPGIKILEPDERRDQITIRDLLAMSSGIEWLDTRVTHLDENCDLKRMVESKDRVDFVLNKPMACEPGVVFNYSNGDSQLLSAIIHRCTKCPTPQFAKDALFDKLHFRNWEWVWPDANGLYPGGYGLRLRPRDMAKFGELFLRRGKWNGQQIVSPEWVDRATAEHANGNYGFQWWIFHNEKGQRISFCAKGLHGQNILVIPGLDMVVAMTSQIDAPTANSTFGTLVNEHIVKTVEADESLPPNPRAVVALKTALDAARRISRKPFDPSDKFAPRIPAR